MEIDVELVGAPAFTVAVEGERFVYAGLNRRLAGMIGFAPGDFVGQTPEAILPPDYATEILAQYRQCVAERRSVDFESLYDSPGGKHWWHSTISPVFASEGGPVVLLIGVAVDITARKAAEARSRETEVRLALAMDILDGGFWHYDIPAGTFATSPQLTRLITGFESGALDLDRYIAVVEPKDLAATDLGPLIRGECEANVAEYRVKTHKGDIRWVSCRRRLTRDAEGQPSAVVGVAVDITDQKRAQEGLALQAATDALTHLLNRRGYEQMGNGMIAGARGGGPGFGLLLIDLDRFKPVNDTHGHATGDEVLRETAIRLRRHARTGDATARIGGDEFALLLEGIDAERLARIAGRLVTVLARPIATLAGPIAVGASVGAALWCPGDRDLSALMARADAELFHVKRTGRGAWRLAA